MSSSCPWSPLTTFSQRNSITFVPISTCIPQILWQMQLQPLWLAQGHNALPQGPTRRLLGATPSSVWPSDLIPILCRIAALPSRQPSKPLFDFSFSLEAANKNFIILKRKFGGDKSSTSPERLSFRLRIGIQAHRDTQADLQKPSDMEPNEASSQTGIKVAPSAP